MVERAPEKREVTGSTPVPTTGKSQFGVYLDQVSGYRPRFRALTCPDRMRTSFVVVPWPLLSPPLAPRCSESRIQRRSKPHPSARQLRTVKLCLGDAALSTASSAVRFWLAAVARPEFSRFDQAWAASLLGSLQLPAGQIIGGDDSHGCWCRGIRSVVGHIFKGSSRRFGQEPSDGEPQHR